MCGLMSSSDEATDDHSAEMLLQGTVRQRYIFIVNYHVRTARAEQSEFQMQNTSLPFLFHMDYISPSGVCLSLLGAFSKRSQPWDLMPGITDVRN